MKSTWLTWGTAIALATGCGVVAVSADDWEQWRGNGRLGVWHERGIIELFPDDGLTVTWRTSLRSGYAGPAVADGRVFVLDWRENTGSRTLDGTERAVALDEATGAVLWTHEWQTSYRMLMASYAVGPRATPTVDGDRVYVVGATGRLFCLDVETGDVIWEKDYVADYDTSVPTWGVASAPLVDGDKLITVVGGEPDALVVAFDKRTGAEIWRSLRVQSDAGYGQPIIYEAGGAHQLIVWHPSALSSLDPETGDEIWRAVEVVAEMGYGQPVIYEAGGARQLIVWHAAALVSLNPDTGEVYWNQAWEARSGLSVATPVQSGDYLLVTQFYNGSMMMRLNQDRPTASLLWQGTGRSELPDQTDGLHSLITTPLIIGDYIYGVGSYGELRGLDARTGERLWMSDQMTAQARWGAAFLVQHEDRYFVNNDDGDLIIAQFTPSGYVELDRTRLIVADGSSGAAVRGRPARFERPINWSHPAYANKHIVHRNNTEIIRASLDVDDY